MLKCASKYAMPEESKTKGIEILEYKLACVCYTSKYIYAFCTYVHTYCKYTFTIRLCCCWCWQIYVPIITKFSIFVHFRVVRFLLVAILINTNPKDRHKYSVEKSLRLKLETC